MNQESYNLIINPQLGQKWIMQEEDDTQIVR